MQNVYKHLIVPDFPKRTKNELQNISIPELNSAKQIFYVVMKFLVSINFNYLKTFILLFDVWVWMLCDMYVYKSALKTEEKTSSYEEICE